MNLCAMCAMEKVKNSQGYFMYQGTSLCLTHLMTHRTDAVAPEEPEAGKSDDVKWVDDES